MLLHQTWPRWATVLFVAVLCAAFWLLMVGVALAQAAPVPSPSGVSIAELVGYALALLFSALTALASWGVTWLVKKIKGDVTAQDQAQINGLIAVGTGWAREHLAEMIKEKGWDHLDTKNAIVKAVATYANTSAPDLMKRQGITEEKVHDMIRARLPSLGSTPGPATPVVVAPAPAA